MKLEIQTRLAHNLKRLRKNRNLTQFELAEKANISEAMVKSIELSLAWPSDKTLSQLSEALDVDIINFFFLRILNLSLIHRCFQISKRWLQKTTTNIFNQF